MCYVLTVSAPQKACACACSRRVVYVVYGGESETEARAHTSHTQTKTCAFNSNSCDIMVGPLDRTSQWIVETHIATHTKLTHCDALDVECDRNV